MAATRLIALHIGKGKTVAKALNDRLDYSQNPDKTEDRKYVSSYECDPETAAEEFALSKKEYYRLTGRTHSNEVIAYQIRQSFKPGEITPEEANRVGYETAMRFTKGRHAFTVSTHIDRAHIHNHIIFNSTTLDNTHKFRNFLRSGLALEVVSNLVCLEHKLSIIRPLPGDMSTSNRFKKRKTIREQIRRDVDSIMNGGAVSFEEILQGLKDNGYEIKSGKHLSVKGKDQKRFIRMDSLGRGYSEVDLKENYKGITKNGKKKTEKSRNDFAFLIDIQAKLRQGKGKGYENWAKVFNIKQTAQVLLFLQNAGISSYEELKQKAEHAAEEFNQHSTDIKTKEQQLTELQELKNAVITYHRTREVFSEYKASHYSNRYLETHREEIISYRSAQEIFKKHKINKLPRVNDLSAEYMRILSEKKEEYAAYKEKRQQMQELLKAQKNIETILNLKEEKGGTKETDRTENVHG